MIHEISHSLDLCRLSGEIEDDISGRDRVKPLNGVAQGFPDLPIEDSPYFSAYTCLLSEEGGGYGQKGLLENAGPLTKGSVCTYNQQHEAFADWNAARIIGANPSSLDLPPAGPTPAPITPLPGGKVVKAPAGLDVLMLQADSGCTENGKKE